MDGLRLITSNRMEDLAAGLAESLRTGAPGPFESEMVLVQSLGMARWLEQQLAGHLGVCAGVEFPFPNAFARRILRAAVPEMGPDEAFTPEALTWRIFALLPGLTGTPGFEPVAHYLGDGSDARRHFQLAARIGSLFDQYLLLRPGLILEWEAGQDLGWQAALWRAVVADLGLGDRPPAHRARGQAEACRRLRDPAVRITGLPARVSVFGISALPPYHVELLSALASRIPVNVHLLQPCREYWGDIVSGREELKALGRLGRAAHEGQGVHLERGHRLLASLGRQGKDFLRVIADHDHFTADGDERFVVTGGDTRLHRLQDDLLELVDRTRPGAGAPRVAFPDSDDSIQVHNCHGSRRELEVLQDHLLKWLAEDPTLQPRDILVMLPDVEGYAPLIHGVFGCPEREAWRIPYTVADRTGRAEGRLGEAVLAVLHLAGSRATAPEILALLESREIQRRFGFEPEDLPRLRAWCEEVRIRWGFDAGHRRALGLPELAAGTWRHGLDRLLVGQAMAPDDRDLVGGIAPYADLEGDAAELAGRWSAFLRTLQRVLESLAEPRSLPDWATRLETLVDELFQSDPSRAAEHREVRQRLGRLRDLGSACGGPVERVAVLEQLGPWLDEEPHGVGFLRGGVTFCGLKPMRSIPARVICLLGLNDGAFPRRREPAGFDLIAAAPQAGDASREADDRYLFLETLISARDRLYLSHVGQSERDNSPRPPSVVVSELIDCLVDSEASTAEEARRVRAGLERRHHLQAFHPAYFQGDDRIFSHSVENHQAGHGLGKAAGNGFVLVPQPLGPLPGNGWPWTPVQLVECFRNPSRFFLRNRLRLRLPDDEALPEDRERFALDAREAYGLKQAWLAERIAGGSLSGWRERARAAGEVPPGSAGDLASRWVAAGVDRFWRGLAPFHPERAGGREEVDLEVGGFRLSGAIPAAVEGVRLHYRCASAKPTDFLRAWIEHLIAQVQAGPGRGLPTVLVAEDGVHRLRPVPEASRRLAELLAWGMEGLASPLRFFPKSAWAFVKQAGKDVAKARSAAAREWESDFQRTPEKDDPHFQVCFGHEEPHPLDARFEELAQGVFGPLREALEEGIA